ncbi:hypothetical protein ACMD2_07308, partial [Ananas comosus]
TQHFTRTQQSQLREENQPTGFFSNFSSSELSRVSMASSSSSEFSSGDVAVKKQQRHGPQFKFLVPLIYAPILPLIRIGLRHNPVVRDRLFFGVLAGAFAHGAYLVYPSFSLTNSILVQWHHTLISLVKFEFYV